MEVVLSGRRRATQSRCPACGRRTADSGHHSASPRAESTYYKQTYIQTDEEYPVDGVNNIITDGTTLYINTDIYNLFQTTTKIISHLNKRFAVLYSLGS